MEVIGTDYLARHVAANMGLDVKPKMGKPAILAAMATAGFETEFLEVEDDTEEDAPIERREPPRTRHTPGKRMVKLLIPVEEKPGGNEPVFTSHNGVAMLIPRNKEVWVPYERYMILMDAVAHIAETDENALITGYRKVPQHPVSAFVVEPELTEAEWRAAAKRTEDEVANFKATREARASVAA